MHGRTFSTSCMRARRYVMQDDVLFHNLSVRETFMVAALLRLPRDMPLPAKHHVVDAVIQELGLAKAADTHIGAGVHSQESADPACGEHVVYST